MKRKRKLLIRAGKKKEADALLKQIQGVKTAPVVKNKKEKVVKKSTKKKR